jgi:hypothetical protein
MGRAPDVDSSLSDLFAYFTIKLTAEKAGLKLDESARTLREALGLKRDEEPPPLEVEVEEEAWWHVKDFLYKVGREFEMWDKEAVFEAGYVGDDLLMRIISSPPWSDLYLKVTCHQASCFQAHLGLICTS